MLTNILSDYQKCQMPLRSSPVCPFNREMRGEPAVVSEHVTLCLDSFNEDGVNRVGFVNWFVTRLAKLRIICPGFFHVLVLFMSGSVCLTRWAKDNVCFGWRLLQS